LKGLVPHGKCVDSKIIKYASQFATIKIAVAFTFQCYLSLHQKLVEYAALFRVFLI
jgi:hypothetical protein